MASSQNIVQPPREFYFVIVGRNDQPLFECDFPVPDPKKVSQGSNTRHLNQFIAHSALDVVDEIALREQQMYLKVVDKFNEWFVSAFISASRVRFLLLHTQRNDDGIKQFFQEAYENYIKYSMNPFYHYDAQITSQAFLKKIIQYGQKYLGV